MLPPPESPGQEKKHTAEPDIVPHYPPRIYAHVFFERKNQLHICSCCFLRRKRQPSHGLIHSLLSSFSGEKHRSRIRCYAFLRKEKPVTYSFMLSSPESLGQEKNMPHEPDIVRHYRLRIYGHVLSERKKHLLHICSCCFLRRKRFRRKNVGINI